MNPAASGCRYGGVTALWRMSICSRFRNYHKFWQTTPRLLVPTADLGCRYGIFNTVKYQLILQFLQLSPSRPLSLLLINPQPPLPSPHCSCEHEHYMDHQLYVAVMVTAVSLFCFRYYVTAVPITTALAAWPVLCRYL